MRGSELFNAAVLDPDGRPVGTVIDLRARPVPERRTLVVEGMVLGRRHVRLFGYERHDEVGPALLSRLAARLHRDTRYAPMGDLDLSTPEVIRLRVAWDELDTLD